MTRKDDSTTSLISRGGYADNFRFRTQEGCEQVPQKLFWSAVSSLFVIANATNAKISAALAAIVDALPTNLTRTLFDSIDVQTTSQEITKHVLVPFKELLFLVALVILACSIGRCLMQSKVIWCRIVSRPMVLSALAMFFGLSLLVFPYSYPRGLHSHPSGLAGMGEWFGQMSVAPFQENNPMISKRLLKPALAHFFHMEGYVRYYLLSLFFTFGLILLTVGLLETRLLARTDGGSYVETPSGAVKWLIYFSAMTSSFILTDFQWPGYSDQLSFILLLVMAITPMTPQARIATLVLCLVNHDGIALAFIPIVLCCFPRPERFIAFVTIGLFYGIAAAVYGFNVQKSLEVQQTVSSIGPVWEAAFTDPGFLLASLFFTYKLLWLAPAVAVALLWRDRDKLTAIAIIAITFLPIAFILIAWDTTRVAGFGWLGLLITFGVLLTKWHERCKSYQYGVIALVSINMLIPTYNVVLGFKNSFSAYPYRGLYVLIDLNSRRVVK